MLSEVHITGNRKRCRLEELAIVKAGNVAPKRDFFTPTGRPFIRAGSLSTLLEGGSLSSLELLSEENADKLKMRLFPKGTVVFAKSGLSCLVGNVYVLPEPCYVVSHLACVVPKEGLSNYLKHYFRFNRPSKLIENPSFPSIKLSKIKAIEINLPELSTAENQAEILEEICDQIENAKLKIQYLDNLVKSRFVEMFGDPAVENNIWPYRCLGEVCTVITGNTPSRKEPDNYGDYIEWCKTDNITDEKYLTKASEMLSEKGASKGRIAPAGSLLMACIAGSIKSIGKVAVADRQVAFNQQINAIVPGESLDVDYLLWAFKLSKDYLCSGVHMQLKGILNKTALSSKRFAIPPLALQEEFAGFVQQVDKSKSIARKQIDKLQLLYDSLAQEYFGD